MCAFLSPWGSFEHRTSRDLSVQREQTGKERTLTLTGCFPFHELPEKPCHESNPSAPGKYTHSHAMTLHTHGPWCNGCTCILFNDAAPPPHTCPWTFQFTLSSCKRKRMCSRNKVEKNAFSTCRGSYTHFYQMTWELRLLLRAHCFSDFMLRCIRSSAIMKVFITLTLIGPENC